MQSMNRYSYVNNNPLTHVDPSGYGWFSNLFRSIGHFFTHLFHEVVKVLKSKIFQEIVQIALLALAPPLGGVLTVAEFIAIDAAYAGFNTLLDGGSITDALESAVITGFEDAAFRAIGSVFDKLPTTFTHTLERSVAHGLVGGTVSSLRGGKFTAGFVGAFSGEFLGKSAQNFVPPGLRENLFIQTGVHGLVGGVSSKLAGGSFAGGFITASKGYVLNSIGNVIERSFSDPQGLQREMLAAHWKQKYSDMRKQANHDIFTKFVLPLYCVGLAGYSVSSSAKSLGGSVVDGFLLLSPFNKPSKAYKLGRLVLNYVAKPVSKALAMGALTRVCVSHGYIEPPWGS